MNNSDFLRLIWAMAIATCFSLSVPLTSSFGLSYDPLTLEEMTQQATAIVVGTVTSAEYRWEQDQLTYLYITLDILNVIVGDPTTKTIRIRQPVANTFEPPGTPVPEIFQIDKHVVVFLSSSKPGYYMLTNASASAFSVEGQKIGSSSFSVEEFVQQIRDVRAGHREHIEGSVPSTAGWSLLGAEYFYLGGQFASKGYHWERPLGGAKLVVHFEYDRHNTPIADDAAVSDAIRAAMDAWEMIIWPAGSGHFIDFQLDGTVDIGTPAPCSNSMTSRIRWDAFPSDSSTSGTAIRCFKDGNDKNPIVGANIWLNLNKQYKIPGYWTQAQVQKVVAHELGHVLGLEHSSISENLMYDPSNTNTPRWGDQSGAVFSNPWNLTGDLPFDMVLAAQSPNQGHVQDAPVTGDLRIGNGRSLRTRSGTPTNLSSGTAIYVPSGSNGTFTDDGASWSPKDVAIKSGTTLKGHTPTIQRALDLASSNGYSTVNAGSGTYTEQVSMKNGVNLIGAGSSSTTIQYSGGVAVTFTAVSNTQLSGFTLKGFFGVSVGSGSSTNVQIDHNTIRDSYVGINLSGSSPTIRDNTLTANGTLEGGGGMYAAYSSDPVMYNGHNNIQNNGGYGILCYNLSEPQLGSGSNQGLNNFTGNGGYNLTANANCGFISAENNWWGTANEDSIRLKLYHGQGLNYIDYNPWRTSPAKLVALGGDPRRAAAQAVYREGRALWLGGNPAEALIHFKRVIEEYGDTEEALFALDLLMNVYEALPGPTDQLPYLEGVAQRYASSELGALAAEFVVRVLVSEGQYAQAIERAQKVVRRYPDRERNEWVQFQIGLLYELLGELAKEAEVFRSFLARYPVNLQQRPNDLLPSLASIRLGLDPYGSGQKQVQGGEIPSGLSFDPVVPNPSNPQTTLTFTLPHEAEVTLVIYNTLGQVVRTLVDHARFTAGRQRIVWDGRDDSHRAVASGIYLARLTTAGQMATQKLVLLK